MSRSVYKEPIEGSAAGDWAHLLDRMNFIVDYFRSRQRKQELLKAPYSPIQVRTIYRGEVPLGSL